MLKSSHLSVLFALGAVLACGSEALRPVPPPAPPKVCQPRAELEANCENALDDDCDGLTDCEDEECGGQTCGMSGLSCSEGACSLGDALPALPTLAKLDFSVRGDDAVFSFLPVEGAKDYRIWELPSSDKIETDADGTTQVSGAIYRCAGKRPLPKAEAALEGSVLGYERSEDEALLGYGYASGSPSRVPVFELGLPTPGADERTGSAFASSRTVIYTTSEKKRKELLLEGYRDDGIAFYAPKEGARPVYGWVSEPQAIEQDRVYYLVFSSEKEKEKREGPSELFALHAETEPGALPIYRVHKTGRDRLALGAALRDRYLSEGNQAMSQLAWSGLSQKTTLVLEALDEGCPFGGHFAAESVPEIEYADPVLSIAEEREKDPSRAIYINGQYAAENQPKAIARSFVTLEPAAAPKYDFYADFLSSGIDQEYKMVSSDTGLKQVRLESDLFHAEFTSIEMESWSLGTSLGQLWVAYADWAADTNGKFRLTAKKKAKLSEKSFLHVFAEVDIPSTHRRYPQILLSDQDAPVQENLEKGATVIVQPFAAISDVQIQVCKNRTWDVNKQCPMFRLGRSLSFEPAYADNETPWQPRPTPGEFSGFDRPVLFDVYLSKNRVYVFLENQPYGCGKLPGGTFEPGELTVTLGDVLYHSGVDEDVICDDCPHEYLKELRLAQAVRRYGRFGFKNGVKEPDWNEVTMPCGDEFDQQ